MSILHWLLMPRPCYLTHVLRLSICCSGLSWHSFSGFVCFLISGIGFEVIPKVWQFDKSQLSHCSLMFSSDLALAMMRNSSTTRIRLEIWDPPEAMIGTIPRQKYTWKVNHFFLFYKVLLRQIQI